MKRGESGIRCSMRVTVLSAASQDKMTPGLGIDPRVGTEAPGSQTCPCQSVRQDPRRPETPPRGLVFRVFPKSASDRDSPTPILSVGIDSYGIAKNTLEMK